MSAIQTQIEKLKSMQESMDVLTDSLVVNPVAKESTIIAESQSIKDKIDNIKLPEIDTTELAKEATLNAVSNKLDNLNVEIDLSEVAKESTLNSVSKKLDNLNVEVDLSTVAKQGENQDATNSAIFSKVNEIFTTFDELYANQLKDIVG